MENRMESRCVNCGSTSEQNYCSNCGQKLAIKKLTWSSFLGELNQRVLGMDNKFARTVADLTIRPEKVVNAFIQGNRTRYIGPIGYFFILITLYVLLISMLDIDMVEFSNSINKSLLGDQAGNVKGQGFRRMVMNQMKALSFVMMPFFILATYLLFLRKGYNFIETSVLVFYAFAHTFLLIIISLFAFKYSSWDMMQFNMVFTILFMSYAYARFYKGNKIWIFIKGTMSYILGMLFLMIAVMAVTYILSLLFPDLIKELFQ